jgi:hypothetical protein
LLYLDVKGGVVYWDDILALRGLKRMARCERRS